MGQAEEKAKDGTMVNWVDLGEPGFRLVALKFPSGAKRLVIIGPKDLRYARERALADMGFYRTKSGIQVRDALQFSLGALRRAFPGAAAAQMPMAHATRIMVPDLVGARPDETVVHINNSVMAAALLGSNHLGQRVYEGEDSRFTVDANGSKVRERDAAEGSGADFLYAFSEDDMALCADAFVAEIARGKTFFFDDLKRFASLITGVPGEEIEHSSSLREVQEALESAIVRHVGRNAAQADRAAFQLALRLEEGQPPLQARSSKSVELQQYSTPMPISIAAQVILGDVSGKTVLEPTIGNGALASLLREANVVGCDLDKSRLARSKRNVEGAFVHEADATVVDFRALNGNEPYDTVIANPPFGGLEKATVIDGLKVTRIDHLILLRALAARKDDGLSVFIVGADSYIDSKAGHVTGGSRYLFNWLADHYEVDVAEVNGHLYGKQGASFPIRIVVVGRKGAGANQVPDHLPIFSDHEELFEWAAAMRLKYSTAAVAPEALAASTNKAQPNGAGAITARDEDPAGGTGADDESAEAVEQNISNAADNSYQSPYRAFSQVGEATAMVPRNLATPTLLALEDVVTAHGDIDRFVARELQWTVDELGKYLSPEQVDAVALAIHANQRGRGFLEGDKTGVGKGRVMAAMARHAVINGRRALFFTETATLFTDFWRDVRDIGSEDLFTPFILNDAVAAYDSITGKVLIPATPKTVVATALASGDLDERYNIVLATYSQFNRDPSVSAKARWIAQISRGACLLMDEAHNAAGDSSTGRNLLRALDECASITYSSATSIKDSGNVQIYWKVLPSSVDIGSLPDTLRAGGEPLQEVLSAMMARDGVFIRRENDLSHLTVTAVVEEQYLERNRQYSDHLAQILELMNYLSGDINQLVNERNAEIRELLKSIPEKERAGNRMGALSLNFGSRLAAIYRQFLMALKVDTVFERAVLALENGKKPVITMENTMESLLAEVAMAAAQRDAEGMDADLASGTLSGETSLNGKLTFRDVLNRMLARLTCYQESDRYGVVTSVPIKSAEALKTIEMIRELIDVFPDLPISPLDDLRTRLAETGFVCDELSGRKLRIVQREEKYLAEARPERAKAHIVRDFNAGTSDALCLTLAGSTGISLHASERFVDQRQRVLIELQPARDVNDRLQFFGRVDRKGQVSAPEIETVSSGLIGEARHIAMQNTKLRKLSANTTSNQENAALDTSIPDFLNAVGDRVAYRYLEANPSIAQRLDIDIDSEDVRREHEFINKLTGRMIMLPVAEQEKIYEALSNEYVRVIDELDAKGINPLRSRELDVRARVIATEVFEAGAPDSGSVFNDPVYLKTIEYDMLVNPMRSTEVKARVAAAAEKVREFEHNVDGCSNDEFFLAFRRSLLANRQVMLASAVKGKDTVDMALAAKEDNAVKKMLCRLGKLDDVLSVLKVGAVVRMSNDEAETAEFGIVTGVRIPTRMEHMHLLGQYDLEIVLPGKERPMIRSLYGLDADPLFRLLPPALGSDVYRAMDAAPQGLLTFRRHILDGNLFKAAQTAAKNALGGSVVYTDEAGNRRRGVLLRAGIDKKDLLNLPVRIETESQCVELLERQPGLEIVSSDDDGGDVKIGLVNGDKASLTVPGTKSRGGRFYNNADLAKLTGEFHGTRDSMVAKFPRNALGLVYGQLLRMGVSLYAPASYRSAINALQNETYNNKSCATKETESRMASMSGRA